MAQLNVSRRAFDPTSDQWTLPVPDTKPYRDNVRRTPD